MFLYSGRMEGCAELKTGDILQFGDFELDISERRLSRGGTPVELGSRYFDALVLMVRSDGALVSKERFMDEVWRGVPVTDEALTQCIRTLRRALGDDASAPRFIATVPKHGYRFCAPVTVRGQGNGGDDMRSVGAATASNRSFAGARIAGAATIGGAIAGAMGGLFYGVAATHGGSASVLILTGLVAMLGVLAGAGVGVALGLAALRKGAGPVAWTLSGAFGGMLVGAVGQVLAREGVASLTGASIGPVTGILEGLVLGSAAGIAAFIAGHLSRSPLRMIGIGAALGALAGAFIALVDGHLLGQSLMALEAHFPASRLDIAQVGALLGESGFTGRARWTATILEAAVFVAVVATAIGMARKR